LSDLLKLADEYYIRASSGLADDRTRVLKYGSTFAVFNRFGDIELAGPSQFGLFHEDCRYLSRFTVLVNKQPALLLSSSVREDNAFLSVDLTNLDSVAGTGQAPPRGTLHIFRHQYLESAAFHTQIRLSNYGSEEADVLIRFAFDADFADIFEARGTKRQHRGQRLEDRLDGDCPVLAYLGLDGVRRCTRLEFSGKPVAAQPSEISVRLHLPPGEEKSLKAAVFCERDSPSSRFSFARKSDVRADPNADPTGLRDCRVRTSNEGFNAWLSRSCADLRMLVEGNPEGPVPYAGVPWFSTVFGRDSIITALECLWLSPVLAEAVLKYLAETQATADIPEQDAEPGKIIHETRRGEMAATKEVPFGRYYGSVDATPLFVMLAGAYFERTANLSLIRQIWPNIKSALAWIDTYGDRDGDGFIEYEARSAHGLVQQGWKDSFDSVFYADGKIAQPPIALCEVQAYKYAAYHAAARLARALGDVELGSHYDRAATSLQERFEKSFWSDEIGSYVIALDGQKKPCVVSTSNAGHALFCEIASRRHAESVASAMMREQLFSGWGVRTLSSSERRYNPMSYHNGSVWPHDTAIVAMGLSNYRMPHCASQILQGLYEASRYLELQRMPELFCGFHKRSDGSGPTLYPVACAPQAWAAGSVFLLLQACLCIRLTSGERPRVSLSQPSLPEAIDTIEIENLQIGNGSVGLRLHRTEQGVSVETTHLQGDVEVHMDR
jgi:glycogen debranching enzyme